MKRYIITVCIIVLMVILGDALYYRLGVYVDVNPNQAVKTFVKTDNEHIYLDDGSGFKEFEIKGVNMGSGIPGEWSTDFAVDKESYLRWFEEIQEMGANTIRIYTLQNDTFYDAFYEYNSGRENPLWLIQGIWVNDYIQNSYRDAYNPEFYDTFLNDCKTVIDAVHGKRKVSVGGMSSAGSGIYKTDISEWIIGYILGVEWQDSTVAYTNDKYKDNERYNQYAGDYMYTSEDATPFEAMLTRVGDTVIEYETNRYNEQRLVAFSNWPTTDPFDYPIETVIETLKFAKVDVEHIKTTENFLAGEFASYHVYPYYPDYLDYVKDFEELGFTDLTEYLNEDGSINTYKAYLSMLTDHHSMPVVISEFGVSTGRGIAQVDSNTGRNQGHMSESEQGQALVECYHDIMDVGCAGCCVFTWQDEWFKRTWNTMYAVNLKRTPYWSDYQTNEQYFGLLSFDPGEEECVSYVDGDVSEWTEKDVVHKNEKGSISMKYDERFVYFMVNYKGFDLGKDRIYIPLDITPKSGSTYCENYDLSFDREADFVIVIDGKENSSIMVQERYEALRSTYSVNVYGFDTYVKGNVPEIDSPKFVDVNMILKEVDNSADEYDVTAEVFETGKLAYGNANPESDDFDSLADFICNGDYIEVKIPWQLLNFADPSRMTIHDDYYDDNYGIEYIEIEKMYVGLGSENESETTTLSEVSLKGWGNKVTYHERLKSSYYVLQELWGED